MGCIWEMGRDEINWGGEENNNNKHQTYHYQHYSLLFLLTSDPSHHSPHTPHQHSRSFRWTICLCVCVCGVLQLQDRSISQLQWTIPPISHPLPRCLESIFQSSCECFTLCYMYGTWKFKLDLAYTRIPIFLKFLYSSQHCRHTTTATQRYSITTATSHSTYVASDVVSLSY